jgi:hypothetical protein
MFNDYNEFTPQNVMVQYFSPNPSSRPIKKSPYVASSSEWSYLASFTNELDPCNWGCKTIIRGPDWIKSTWADIRKYLHQMFVQYHRSGQHDPDMDEWMSEKENKCWARAAGWKTRETNNVIRHQQAMIYSIAVLNLCDFESIGCKMPKGTRFDASINNGSTVEKHRVRKRKSNGDKENKKPKVNGSIEAIALAITNGSAREAKMSALCLLLEYGSTADKQKAREELSAIAHASVQSNVGTEDSTNVDVADSDDDESL